MTNGGWRKSTFSAIGECVEVSTGPGVVLVRDSKHPDGDVLRFTGPEFLAWIDGCKAGEFDDLA